MTHIKAQDKNVSSPAPFRVTQTDLSLKELQVNVKKGYYQLAISRDSIYFLALWEGVARGQAALLQVSTLIRTVDVLPTSHSVEVLGSGICRPGQTCIPCTAHLTL